jgi:hypothetical protein
MLWFFLVVYYAGKMVDPVEKRATAVSCMQNWIGLGLVAMNVLKMKALTVKSVAQKQRRWNVTFMSNG